MNLKSKIPFIVSFRLLNIVIYIFIDLCNFFRLTPETVEIMAVRMIHVLALDRFNDFVTGSNAVAPVREAIGKGFSLLMLKVGIKTPLVTALIQPLRQLLAMKNEGVSILSLYCSCIAL